ncbi:MAG TPA: hypothetical protein VEV61_14685 [Streptosporangiaceae bacterium]|nr:hypothetical protein [Streptosporangiaceae bacterium]
MTTGSVLRDSATRHDGGTNQDDDKHSSPRPHGRPGPDLHDSPYSFSPHPLGTALATWRADHVIVSLALPR